METPNEKQLAAEIDRELKALPELRAPESLMARVIMRIEHPVTVPWYRRSWQSWSLPVRMAAMGLLVAFLAALCFGTWGLSQSSGLALWVHELARSFSSLSAIWHAVDLIGGTFLLAVKQLGNAVLLAAVAAIALAWAACIGIGTVYFRFAFARR